MSYNLSLKVGDTVKATWPDGLTCIGIYFGQERGYIILMSKDNNKIVCNKDIVRFELLDKGNDA